MGGPVPCTRARGRRGWATCAILWSCLLQFRRHARLHCCVRLPLAASELGPDQEVSSQEGKASPRRGGGLVPNREVPATGLPTRGTFCLPWGPAMDKKTCPWGLRVRHAHLRITGRDHHPLP